MLHNKALRDINLLCAQMYGLHPKSFGDPNPLFLVIISSKESILFIDACIKMLSDSYLKPPMDTNKILPNY